MFAEFMNLDYEELFPGTGGSSQVAFLFQRLEKFECQLKAAEAASAAEAAEAALKLEGEQETVRVAETCRGMLEFLSSGAAPLEPETREVLLAEYMASLRGKSSPGP